MTLLSLAHSAASGQARPYNILLTNDDGVESPGLHALAAALESVGQVYVVAPCGESSGSSMGFTLPAELEVRLVGDYRCVDTTPAGTVFLAFSSLAPEGGFDLVVSGINRGHNVGTASHISGTVGAAMMGAYHSTPAVAASLGVRNGEFSYAARFVAAFVEEMKLRAPRPGIVYSINIPQATEAATTGVKAAKMGGRLNRVVFVEQTSEEVVRRFLPQRTPESEFPENSDTAAFVENMITITPLHFDWTDYDALEDLATWSLDHTIGR
jgi:5'-nucleotidase